MRLRISFAMYDSFIKTRASQFNYERNASSDNLVSIQLIQKK